MAEWISVEDRMPEEPYGCSTVEMVMTGKGRNEA